MMDPKWINSLPHEVKIFILFSFFTSHLFFYHTFQILPNIFKFVPLNVRKNIRLTCRSWNEACNHPDITRYEKFVFRRATFDNDNMECMVLCIQNCRVLRKKLEFHRVALSKLPSSILWKECGTRIESLFLHECAVNDDTIKNIIIYCSNLTSFYLSLWPYSSEDLKFCSEVTLDDLINSKVERRRLHSFKLHFPGVTTEMFQKIFRIYPCIRTFGLGCNGTIFDHENLEPPAMLENFTCKAIHKPSTIVSLCRNPRLKYDS